MPLSALRLGEALAYRLNAIVPSPIHVSAEPPSSSALRRDADVIVRVAHRAEPWSSQGFSNVDLRPRGDSSLGDVACDMAVAMLGGVQDSVVRILRERWPRLPTGDLTLPDGRADSERVYLWYGVSEDRAAVTLEPIELREISL
jgi:hypothetical protein